MPNNIKLKNITDVNIMRGTSGQGPWEFTNPAYYIYGDDIEIPEKSPYYEDKKPEDAKFSKNHGKIIVHFDNRWLSDINMPLIDENSVQMKMAKPLILEATYYSVYGRRSKSDLESVLLAIRAIKLTYQAAQILATSYIPSLQEKFLVNFMSSSSCGQEIFFEQTCRRIFYALSTVPYIKNTLYTREQLYDELVYIGNLYFALLHSRNNSIRIQNGTPITEKDLANSPYMFTAYEKLKYPNELLNMEPRKSISSEIKKLIALAHEKVYGRKLDVFFYFEVCASKDLYITGIGPKKNYKLLKPNYAELARMKHNAYVNSLNRQKNKVAPAEQQENTDKAKLVCT